MFNKASIYFTDFYFLQPKSQKNIFMKNTQTVNQAFTQIKTTIAILLLLLNITTQAQTVNWRSVTWLQKEYGSTANTVTQRQSDYDWWYDHATGYDRTTGTHIGYIAAGVSDYRCAERSNITNPATVYDEQAIGGCAFYTTPLSTGLPHNDANYDYGNWENEVSGKLGMPFNTIGKIGANGSNDYLITMNVGGEYLRTKKLQDGYYMTVGNTWSTRKKADAPQFGAPLYYNPSATSPNNQFNYSEIYYQPTGTTITPTLSSHWDVMKFDGNDGTCKFNAIYGISKFNEQGSFSVGAYSGVTGKQKAYLTGGEAKDFTQDAD